MAYSKKCDAVKQRSRTNRRYTARSGLLGDTDVAV